MVSSKAPHVPLLYPGLGLNPHGIVGLKNSTLLPLSQVTKPPHIRFYCGAPLIASNGHRLGTLCFTDVKPRAWDAGSCMIMNNLSELVVRQLEKGIALKVGRV